MKQETHTYMELAKSIIETIEDKWATASECYSDGEFSHCKPKILDGAVSFLHEKLHELKNDKFPRYILFAFRCYDSMGGAGDYIKPFRTIEDLFTYIEKNCVSSEDYYGNVYFRDDPYEIDHDELQIYDSIREKVIAEICIRGLEVTIADVIELLKQNKS